MYFELSKIGFISRAHGFKGELKAVLDCELRQNKITKYIFLYQDGKPVPFFVEEFSYKGDQLLLKLEGIDKEQQAIKLKNTSMYCESKLFEDFFIANESLDDLIGFDVHDKQHGAIGTVVGIIENSIQPTLVVSYQNKEILIPYSQDIILEIMEIEKVIEIEAPNGLINMYLE